MKSKAEKAEYMRAWYQQHPEWSREYQKRNREAVNGYARAYNSRNRERRRQLWRTWNRDVRMPIIEAEKLLRGACLDCGLVVTPDNLCVFDFDHRDPDAKRSTIARTNPGYLAEEMAKCDLRCANCHRLKTWRMGESKNRALRNAVPEPTHDTLF